MGVRHWDSFKKEFKPVDQAPTVAGVVDDEETCEEYFLETYGHELEIVRATPAHYVWTVVDVGTYRLRVQAGYHMTNRVNYIITAVPWATGKEEFYY